MGFLDELSHDPNDNVDAWFRYLDQFQKFRPPDDSSLVDPYEGFTSSTDQSKGTGFSQLPIDVLKNTGFTKLPTNPLQDPGFPSITDSTTQEGFTPTIDDKFDVLKSLGTSTPAVNIIKPLQSTDSKTAVQHADPTLLVGGGAATAADLTQAPTSADDMFRKVTGIDFSTLDAAAKSLANRNYGGTFNPYLLSQALLNKGGEEAEGGTQESDQRAVTGGGDLVRQAATGDEGHSLPPEVQGVLSDVKSSVENEKPLPPVEPVPVEPPEGTMLPEFNPQGRDEAAQRQRETFADAEQNRYPVRPPSSPAAEIPNVPSDYLSKAIQADTSGTPFTKAMQNQLSSGRGFTTSQLNAIQARWGLPAAKMQYADAYAEHTANPSEVTSNALIAASSNFARVRRIAAESAAARRAAASAPDPGTDWRTGEPLSPPTENARLIEGASVGPTSEEQQGIDQLFRAATPVDTNDIHPVAHVDADAPRNPQLDRLNATTSDEQAQAFQKMLDEHYATTGEVHPMEGQPPPPPIGGAGGAGDSVSNGEEPSASQGPIQSEEEWAAQTFGRGAIKNADGSITIDPSKPPPLGPIGGSVSQRMQFQAMRAREQAAAFPTTVRLNAARNDIQLGDVLKNYVGDNSLMQSLKAQYAKNGMLSPKQWDVVQSTTGAVKAPVSGAVNVPVELGGNGGRLAGAFQGLRELAQPAREDGPVTESIFRDMAGKREQAIIENAQAMREAGTVEEKAQIGAALPEQLNGIMTGMWKDLRDAGRIVTENQPGLKEVPGAPGYFTTPTLAKALRNTYGEAIEHYTGDHGPATSADLDQLFGKNARPIVDSLLSIQGGAKESILMFSGYHFATLSRQLGRIAEQAALNGSGPEAIVAGAHTLRQSWWHAINPIANTAWKRTPEIKELFSRAGRAGVTLLERRPGQFGPDANVSKALPGTAVAAAGLSKLGINSDAMTVTRAVQRGLFSGIGGAAFGAGQAKLEGKEDEMGQRALQYGAEGALAGMVGGRVIGDALWGRFVPTAKVQAWNMLVKSGMDEKVAADHINNVFGGQNLAAMARNPDFQRLLHVIMLAPDWRESWIRQGLSTFTSGAEGKAGRQFAPIAMAGALLATEATSMALSGHFTWQDDQGNTTLNHLGEVDASKLLNPETAGFATHGHPFQEHKVYLDVAGLGPLPSEAKAFLSGPMHAAQIAGPGRPDLASSATTEGRGLYNEAIGQGSPGLGAVAEVGRGMTLGQSPGDIAINVAGRTAPISIQGVGKKGLPWELGGAAQLTGSRPTVLAADSPTMTEAKRLGLEDPKTGWPTAFTRNTPITPTAIDARRMEIRPLPIELTSEERAKMEQSQFVRMNAKYAHDQDHPIWPGGPTYKALPDKGLDMSEELRLRAGARGGLNTFHPDSKTAYLQWLSAIAQQTITRDVLNGMSKSEILARQRAAYNTTQKNRDARAAAIVGR